MHNNNQNIVYRLVTAFGAWGIVTFARLLTAVQPFWQGADPTRQKTCVYFANHVSHGDFVLIWATLPKRLRYRTRPVAGADYWRKNRLRRFIGEGIFNSVLIARTPQAHGSHPIAQMTEALDEGASLIVFPEGTRNLNDTDLLAFKSGLFRLAQARPEIELVPVWIDNLNRVLPKGAFVPVPLMCRVVFGAPLVLQDNETKPDFLDRARKALLALRPGVEKP
ncbi:lysophospholipid acyltransferase family protein [Martelella mangrovi]|uniref:1-acyl-sn-glycerol-3-phosphate acyltransferase n=1 Tax=Martelella mangrovi TaxID=1397477 RepID=A0ABV2IHK5_9HYPH